MSPTMSDDRPAALLSAPETRRFLNAFVKRRVNASDADDVVQTVLCDALQAARIPDTDTELRRWLTGIARHKIADLHRKAGREQPSELADLESPPAPIEERQMAEWAEDQTQKSKEAERTLRWMAREGEGEKLEQIAAEEKVEAATVRQRVSRMRRWMKERWLAELAAVAVIVIAGVFVWRFLTTPPVEVVRDPSASGTPNPSPIERAVALRRFALEACKRSEFGPCLEQLDRARDLDPEGDSTPEVTEARQGAKKALEKEKQAPQNVGPTNDGPTSDGPTSDGPTSNDTDNAPKGKTQVQTKSNELAPPVKPAPSVSPNQNGTPFPTPTFNPTKGGTPKGKPSAPKKESSLGSKPGASDSAPGSGIDLGSEPASSPPMPQQAPSPQMQQQPFSGQGKK